jgi:hypothetical protein
MPGCFCADAVAFACTYILYTYTHTPVTRALSLARAGKFQLHLIIIIIMVLHHHPSISMDLIDHPRSPLCVANVSHVNFSVNRIENSALSRFIEFIIDIMRCEFA